MMFFKNINVGEKRLPQAQIYIPVDKTVTWDKFKEICERDGVKISTRLMSYVEKYVSVHRDGNSQTLIDFAGEVKTLPKYKTCPKSNQKLVKNTFYCEQDHVWLNPKACDRCDGYSRFIRLEEKGILK
jgi:hypothetical protein